MYITYEEYSDLYDPVEETVFNRLVIDACRVMDIHTTGIDNVRKLQRFFPSDEYDVKAVKHCAARLINVLFQIQEAETAAATCRGYTETEQGMRSKVVSSVSAGNESISYATKVSSETAIDAAVKDSGEKEKLLRSIVRNGLISVDDANHVSLLYMGAYPRRYLC